MEKVSMFIHLADSIVYYGRLVVMTIYEYVHSAVVVHTLNIWFYLFFPGATTPVGGCILQPSSGL